MKYCESATRVRARLIRHRTAPPALCITLVMACVAAPPAFAKTPPTPRALVKIVQIQARTITRRLRAYGTTEADPDRQASISIPIQGIVGRVSVRLGEIVPAGAPLLEVDTAPNASAAFEQARVALRFAKRAAQRTNDLYKKGFATKTQNDTAERDLANAQAQYDAQNRLGAGASRSVLKAPFTGIVNRLSVAAGDRVAADTLALSIVPRDAIVVPLGVEPEDAPHIKRGQRVEVRSIFANPSVPVAGEISAVQGIVDPTTGLIDVLVHLEPADAGALMIGTRVEGQIVISQQKMLAVPRSALLTSGGRAYVYAVRNDRARRVFVKLGPKDRRWVGITSGLEPGEHIVTLGNYELSDGAPVRVASK
ncbi:MAG TPA: efflux RND transporter periplasmic adaptor subunit [Beijerinckiaceae bacterium]|nr:efflux RND transporter periplasmic adaptor subunit [Beijerinckiaceae bacterium]